MIIRLLLVALCFPLFAEQSVQIDDIYNRLSKEEKNKIERVLKRVVRFHTFWLKDKKDIKIRTLVFASKNRFEVYQRSLATKVSSEAGMFSTYKNESLISMDSTNYLETIIHESQHAIMHRAVNKVPLWIDEGVSEYFENAVFENKKYFVKKHDCKLITEKVDLKDFLKIKNDSVWRGENERLHYEMSWSLIYFFMSDSSKKSALKKIMQDLKDEKKDSVEVINKRYVGGIKKLEKDWRNFLKTMPDKQKI